MSDTHLDSCAVQITCNGQSFIANSLHIQMEEPYEYEFFRGLVGFRSQPPHGHLTVTTFDEPESIYFTLAQASQLEVRVDPTDQNVVMFNEARLTSISTNMIENGTTMMELTWIFSGRHSNIQPPMELRDDEHTIFEVHDGMHWDRDDFTFTLIGAGEIWSAQPQPKNVNWAKEGF